MKPPSRSRLLGAALVLSLAGTGVASAAQLSLRDGSVAAGRSVVARCDDAVSATTTWSGSTKTSVTVGDIAAACAGGTLSVTLTNAGAPVATAGPVTVPAGGGQVVLAVSATGTVTDAQVTVVGP